MGHVVVAAKNKGTRPVIITATEHATARSAVHDATRSTGYRAITLEGKWYTTPKADADRLEAAGVSFAFVGVHNGRWCTVPVN